MAECRITRSLTAPALREACTEVACPPLETYLTRSATAPKEVIHDMVHESDASTDLASEPDISDEVFVTGSALCLIDWDDTILPTTWLSRRGLLNKRVSVTEEQRSQLSALAEAAGATLEAAAIHGRVVIITNAGEGWVQQSCAHFMPSLVPLLQQVPVVSARAIFEPLGIRSPTEWKCRAFETEMEGVADTLPSIQGFSLIAIGDSSQEHEAVLRAAQKVPGCFAKSLRFAERPTPDQLIEEHSLVAGTLNDVVAHVGDLDIEVAPSS